ncbi:NADH oxidoreductase [Phytobacter diazotrophicus]|uniref:NADH oxidoreductase n=1 Tax=Citrobacter bitternis TaxID=1585982 RepID=A0ABW1Q094_9ENTR|nr:MULTISPECIES: NADH oxidoreductase [Phytobacter]AUU90143.1 NADH oxidoreductase [Enterobacteriaceae bacterium ENNIH3]AUV09770.1 NADH oxidoreductase [Enterobacteriaceae bacterium ENNIH2]MDU7133531.1 NADH oxidoreductase [Enterobacteriaceae bacterium]PWF51346.1 NADH oxidoreductase [[Kluyvera] intestini]QIH64379.1 NADH oxidoreductase [Enterobacteriaceae bacterium A-F18]SLK16991.1 NADH oxidoreductase Hcr [Enterobacter sp. NFR05]
MTMPTPQCPWRMQVHHIQQETPDVWTLSLLCHDYYPYRAGQYALVSIRNSAEQMRAYTISSTPGVSEYITLTIRRLDGGLGSEWLTRDVKRGDYLWLSDAQGEFTCDNKASDKLLLLAAGCGVTPIMSMRRWLAKYRPQVDVQVIFSVRSPQDVIFADEWKNYPVTLVAENNATAGFLAGRLTQEILRSVPDLAARTVMTCGPAPYMDQVEKDVKALGVTQFFNEKFFTPVAEAATSGLTFTKLQPAKTFYGPVGTTLLEAFESNKVPVNAACRAGVCGSCKTKVMSGKYSVTSTMTLTPQEIAEGYVLACSCHPESDLVLA